LHLLIAALFGWLERQQRDVIDFLREENRVLKRQLHGRRLQLCDDERRRLAVLGERLGRRVLVQVTSLVRPETILRWHREALVHESCGLGVEEPGFARSGWGVALTNQTKGMRSRIHPTYKAKYGVANWASYDRSLVVAITKVDPRRFRAC
jgi:hypothetical protein